MKEFKLKITMTAKINADSFLKAVQSIAKIINSNGVVFHIEEISTEAKESDERGAEA